MNIYADKIQENKNQSTANGDSQMQSGGGVAFQFVDNRAEAVEKTERGTDLRYIQVLLGHNSSKTTEIYTHVTTKGFKNISSPLDEMEM